jgi:hypothetical protein
VRRITVRKPRLLRRLLLPPESGEKGDDEEDGDAKVTIPGPWSRAKVYENGHPKPVAAAAPSYSTKEIFAGVRFPCSGSAF